MFDDPKPDDTVCMKVSEFNELINTNLKKAVSRLLDKEFCVQSPGGIHIYWCSLDPDGGYSVGTDETYTEVKQWHRDFDKKDEAIDFFFEKVKEAGDLGEEE
jgi:hypothetical protein